MVATKAKKALIKLKESHVKGMASVDIISQKHWFNVVKVASDHLLSLAEGQGWDIHEPQPVEVEWPTVAGYSIYENFEDFQKEQDWMAILNYLKNIRQCNLGVHGFSNTEDYKLVTHLMGSADLFSEILVPVKDVQKPPFEHGKAIKLVPQETTAQVSVRQGRPIGGVGITVCQACNNTGIASNGGICVPCNHSQKATKQQPTRGVFTAIHDATQISAGSRVTTFWSDTVYTVKHWTANGSVSVLGDGHATPFLVEPGDLRTIQAT